jgi:hypothetical protein
MAIITQILKDMLLETDLTELSFEDCNPAGNDITISNRAIFQLKNTGTIQRSISYVTGLDNWLKTFTIVKTIEAGETLTSGLLAKYNSGILHITYPLGIGTVEETPDAWAVGTTYTKDDKVKEGSVYYIAIEEDEDPPNIAIEPGVTTDWEDFWELYELVTTPELQINVFNA